MKIDVEAVRRTVEENMKNRMVMPAQTAQDQPLWQRTLNFMFRPQRAFTGGLANLTDKDPNTGFWGGYNAGITGKKMVDFDQTMNNLGWFQRGESDKYNFWQGKKGKFDFFDIVNFGGNTVADPLTITGLGGMSAFKAGSRAMGREAIAQGAKYGVKPVGSIWSKSGAKALKIQTPDLIEQALIKKGKSADEIAEELTQVRAAIDNAGKAARLKGQNALFSVDIPFTNISKAFGKKPDFLKIVDNTVTPEQVIGATNMLGRISGEAASTADVQSLLKQRYGKDDLSKLTMQELNDLQQLSKFQYSRAPITVPFSSKISKKNMIPEVFKLLQQANPQKYANATQDFLNNFKKADLQKFADTAVKIINAGKKSQNTFVDEAMDFLGKYKFQQGSGGVSKLGNMLRPLNPFNARSVALNKNPLINRAANFYMDTKNRILSRTRQIEKDLESLTKAAGGVSEKELKAVSYVMENQFPKQYGDLDTFLKATVGHTKNAQKIKDIAQMMKERLDVYGRQEVEAGLRTNQIGDYFPHIQDFDSLEKAGLRQAIEQFSNDPKIGRFIQQNANNPYANTRKSFKTLAEVDDKVAELKQEILQYQKGTPEYDKLEKQIQTLEMLFKRDPIPVFEQRSKTAIRSAAMKNLLDQYILDGAIIPNVKGGKLTEEQSKAGMRLLDKREVEAIGLTNIIGTIKTGKKGEQFTVAMHDKLKKLLSESTKYSEREVINRSFEILNSATNVFKTLYTSLVPKHYFYNFVGSVFNNTMAGVTVDSYFKAGKIMQKMRNGTLTAKEQKLVDFALDEGILNQTAFADLVRPDVLMKGRKVEEEYKSFYNKIDKTNQFVVDNPVSKRMRKYLGDPTDNLTRLAHYMHVYETTGSVKLASESVRVHLFNYNELTSTDRLIKTVFPFWNWLKNNMPLQMSKFITEPRVASAWERMQTESFGEDDVGNYPKYIQEGFMKTPWGEQTFYNPRTPVQDLSQLNNPFKTMLNSLSPVFKMPTELYFNEQVFSENPISREKDLRRESNYYENDKVRDDFGKYMLNNAGIIGDIWDTQKKLRDKEEDKSWIDILSDNLLGTTTQLK